MEGTSWVILPNKERYEIKMPNVYATGILYVPLLSLQIVLTLTIELEP